jgi:hypothetical protein
MDEENAGRPPEDQTGPPLEGADLFDEAAGAVDGRGELDEESEDATRVLAGDTAEPTRVMPTDDVAEPTRVMPASEAAAPPPGPQPTLVLSSRPPREGSSTGWIVVIVILAALAAAAGAWYFLLRDRGAEPAPTPAPTPTTAFAWVGAWAPTDGSGGGIVVQNSSGEYQITVYDTMVRVLGSAVAEEDGDDLTFGLETSESLAGIPGPYDVVLSPGAGDDEIKMSVTGANGTTISMPLARVPALVPVTPSSSPSPTLSPSPTVTPTASPTASPSASPTQSAEAQQVIDGIDRIQAGVMTWSANNNGLYPQPQEVTASGDVAQFVEPWPTNPYSGATMSPGTEPGSYIYEQLNGGAGYRLTGYVSGGLTYTVP